MRFTAVPMLLALSACGETDLCADTDAAKINAFVLSQGIVEDRLKSPTSAEFPRITDDGVSVYSSTPCEFAVFGYVDAQNGFGAVVRSTYSMLLTVSDDQESFTAREVKIVSP